MIGWALSEGKWGFCFPYYFALFCLLASNIYFLYILGCLPGFFCLINISLMCLPIKKKIILSVVGVKHDDLSLEEWKLVVKLKNLFKIQWVSSRRSGWRNCSRIWAGGGAGPSLSYRRGHLSRENSRRLFCFMLPKLCHIIIF